MGAGHGGSECGRRSCLLPGYLAYPGGALDCEPDYDADPQVAAGYLNESERVSSVTWAKAGVIDDIG